MITEVPQPFKSLLEQTMRERNVERSHGNKLTGDAASRLLTNSEHFANVLQSRTFMVRRSKKHVQIGGKYASTISTVLQALDAVAKDLNCATPLCQHELDKLEQNIGFIAHWLQTKYPDETVTPLMHMLFMHVPQFARDHGSVS